MGQNDIKVITLFDPVKCNMTVSKQHTRKVNPEQTITAEQFEFAQVAKVGKEVGRGSITPLNSNTHTLEVPVLHLLSLSSLLALVICSNVAKVRIDTVSKSKVNIKSCQLLSLIWLDSNNFRSFLRRDVGPNKCTVKPCAIVIV